MDETAVQIIKAEIRRHRSLSTMANDMRLKVDHLMVAWALEDLLSAADKEKKIMAIKMEQKPMTRGDQIRAQVADDQGLARFIMQIEELEGPQYCQCRPECYAALEELNGIDNDKCAQCLVQWLGREARPAEEPGGEPNG